MARGLWRSWIEQNGADIWSARIELRRGEWADVDHAAYEAEGHEPPFWDLPLKEDYMEAGKIEPIDVQIARSELQFMPGVIIMMIIAGGITVTLFAVWLYLASR
jgi:hypothetical protein